MSRSRSRPRERPDEDLVRLYLGEVGQHALLTRDDEVRLAQAIEAGRVARDRLSASADHDALSITNELRRQAQVGEEATETFVKANLRLVVSIANKYQAAGRPLLDLIQEGNFGLLHAVEKFDWRKGFKFSTYATWWIRQAITRGRDNTARGMRLPLHAAGLLTRVVKARDRLEGQLARRPTVAELAADLALEERKVTEILQYVAEPLSLSAPLWNKDGEVGDLVEDRFAVSPFDAAAASLLPAEVAKLLGCLDEREKEILRLHFGLDGGEPRTLAEVGLHLHLSRERIRQIEAKAMAKLRHPSFNFGLREFLTD